MPHFPLMLLCMYISLKIYCLPVFLFFTFDEWNYPAFFCDLFRSVLCFLRFIHVDTFRYSSLFSLLNANSMCNYTAICWNVVLMMGVWVISCLGDRSSCYALLLTYACMLWHICCHMYYVAIVLIKYVTIFVKLFIYFSHPIQSYNALDDGKHQVHSVYCFLLRVGR